MPDPRIWPIDNVLDTFAEVTDESAVCLPANQNRADADLTNDSDEWIYLGRGNEAVIGSGEPLAPNGGSYHMGTNNLFLGDIYAISTVDQGTSNLAISEGRRP